MRASDASVFEGVRERCQNLGPDGVAGDERALVPTSPRSGEGGRPELGISAQDVDQHARIDSGDRYDSHTDVVKDQDGFATLRFARFDRQALKTFCTPRRPATRASMSSRVE
jgi:hypothetical protein